MPKVTVIVPIYNVEAYIEKCVRSLFEQTLDDIEFIFVDDCSPDNSIQILKKVLLEYPLREKNVKIIRLPYNQKQHKARIKGIEEATGDYIIHCDPDDYVDRLMYKTLYERAIEENCDIVWCGYKKVNKDLVICHKEKCACNQETILTALFDGSLMGSLCNKLVKKEIVKNISIVQPQSPFAEDLLLVSQYVMLAKSFFYLEKEYYNYVVRENSIISYYRTSDDLIFKKLDLIKKNLILLHKVVHLHSFDKLLSSFMIRQKFNLKQSLLPLVLRDKTYSYWVDCFPEINISLFSCRYITLREKMISILLLSHLYLLLRKFILLIERK